MLRFVPAEIQFRLGNNFLKERERLKGNVFEADAACIGAFIWRFQKKEKKKKLMN